MDPKADKLLRDEEYGGDHHNDNERLLTQPSIYEEHIDE